MACPSARSVASSKSVSPLSDRSDGDNLPATSFFASLADSFCRSSRISVPLTSERSSTSLSSSFLKPGTVRVFTPASLCTSMRFLRTSVLVRTGGASTGFSPGGGKPAPFSFAVRNRAFSAADFLRRSSASSSFIRARYSAADNSFSQSALAATRFVMARSFSVLSCFVERSSASVRCLSWYDCHNTSVASHATVAHRRPDTTAAATAMSRQWAAAKSSQRLFAEGASAQTSSSRISEEIVVSDSDRTSEALLAMASLLSESADKSAATSIADLQFGHLPAFPAEDVESLMIVEQLGQRNLAMPGSARGGGTCWSAA